MDHNNHDTWIKQGGRSLFDRAHERAEQLLARHASLSLDGKALEEIYKIARG
jgi:trimethylamine:corrinoid methyltransferase-like protein